MSSSPKYDTVELPDDDNDSECRSVICAVGPIIFIPRYFNGLVFCNLIPFLVFCYLIPVLYEFKISLIATRYSTWCGLVCNDYIYHEIMLDI